MTKDKTPLQEFSEALVRQEAKNHEWPEGSVMEITSTVIGHGEDAECNVKFTVHFDLKPNETRK